jgi:transcriptional regulator with XRE-family HTH domain
MTSNATMTRPQRYFYEEIGERIKAARLRNRMTQEQLGRRIGLRTGVAIHYWEHGQGNISLWQTRELERVLGEGIYL